MHLPQQLLCAQILLAGHCVIVWEAFIRRAFRLCISPAILPALIYIKSLDVLTS
jgi:hypothetical protein